VNSTVLSFAANLSLVGTFLPQVPQNQISFRASYLGKSGDAILHGQFGGQQFDDDQNQLPLGRAISIDAEVSRQLGKHLSMFFAVQYLTNDRFNVAPTPVFIEGPPVFARGGMRFSRQ
jgi:hypothetical protein